MYPPHHLGGYELACEDAVKRWRARGHTVTVLTGNIRFAHAPPPTDDAVRDLQLYWRDGVVVSPSLRERIAIERSNLACLRRVLDDTRPDVVSVWHMGGLSLGLLTELTRRSVPMVLVLEDQWLVYGPEVDAWMMTFSRRRTRWLRGAAARLTGTHTTVDLRGDSAASFASDWLRRTSEQRSPLGLPTRRVTIYGGIDHDTFTPGPRHGFRWRLVCAGRVEERKGVHVAVDAMAHLPDEAVLDIVGAWDEPTYVSRLRERAKELGVDGRITWHGPATRAGVADAFRAADVCLFPVVWHEPFGMVPLEAMATGTALVGTGTGGSGEFLLDGVNCLRVPPEDPVALAGAVRRLADDDLRERLVRRGLATAAYFNDDVYSRELEAWHLAAAERFASGTPVPRAPLADTLQTVVADESTTKD